jgi:hypothetical protein
MGWLIAGAATAKFLIHLRRRRDPTPTSATSYWTCMVVVGWDQQIVNYFKYKE